MPVYKYEGAYANGERVNGVVEAASKTDAVAQIRRSCEVVLSLKQLPRAVPRDPLERLRRIDMKSLALTCQQFSIILKAGLPLVQSVELAAGQTDDKALSSLLHQAAEDVSNGWSLSYSLDQRGSRLPATFRESIRAGEESGDLASSFQRMADYYDRMNKTRRKAASALTYPAFVIAVAVVVIAIIMGYAVPTFTAMFVSMGAELPWATVALIAMSDFFSKHSLALLLGLALVVLVVRLYGTTSGGALRLSRLRLLLPIVGEIGRMSSASQFAHTMSTMLASGMPILQAIEVAGRAVSNRCMAEEIAGTAAGVESGRTLGECLARTREVPEMLVQMTVVGEATGSLEATLEILAEYYDNEVDTRTDRALSLLEPAIIVVLAVFVVFILMAVYLPLFSMYSSM